jgi:polar amino acid transport system permease protein
MEFWVVQKHIPLIIEGVKNTMILAVAGIGGGIILGFFVAIAQMQKFKPIQWVAVVFKEIFRCSPLIVMLIWFFYCLPVLFNVKLPALWVGSLALIGYGGACYGETFRSGLQAIPQEQKDAAKSLSLSPVQTYVYVLIPQLFRIVIPPTLSWSISILKESSIASVIAVNEVMFVCRSLSHETYLPFEFLTAAAITYYIIAAPLENLVSYLEERLKTKTAT